MGKIKEAKVYIAGKITGDPNYQKKFAEAENKLKSKYPEFKFDIFNPAKMEFPDGVTHQEIMDVCFQVLRKSDCVFFLPDWKESKGACMERGFSYALNIPIVDF